VALYKCCLLLLLLLFLLLLLDATIRCDIIHILALRKLQYFFRIQRGQNVVLYNVLQRFKLSDEYLKPLTAYRCGGRDSAKHCIERHFAVLVNRHL